MGIWRRKHGRAVLLGSLTLLLSARVPFPNKVSCFVSTRVSSDNSFRVLDKSPVSGPGRGPPSCNMLRSHKTGSCDPALRSPAREETPQCPRLPPLDPVTEVKNPPANAGDAGDVGSILGSPRMQEPEDGIAQTVLRATGACVH